MRTNGSSGESVTHSRSPTSSRTRPSSHAGSGVAISIVAIFCCFRAVARLIGIYGVVSYTVVQRTREMGVRLALGSRAVQVRAMLLGQGLVAVLVGLLCGVFASLSSGRFLANPFEGVNAMDAAAYALSAARLLIVAVLSIWLPTHRIARLNIIDILRAESRPADRL